MEAMIVEGGIVLVGGTRSQRRRALMTKRGLTFRDPDITGLKRVEIQFNDGAKFRTPYGAKVVAARRRRNKVAKQARKVNR